MSSSDSSSSSNSGPVASDSEDSVSCHSNEFKCQSGVEVDDVYEADNQPRAGFEVVNMLQQQVNATSWPDGPSNLNDLFLWPHYNCCCLLNHPDVGDQCTANALAVMDYDIYINDCYSGTGCGSISLWLQHDELKRILTEKGLNPGDGKVIVNTSSDTDQNCRKVLASLDKAFRPNCIFGSLESRVQPKVLTKLNSIREESLRLHEQAKCYMTDGDKAEEAALLQEHGKQTFAKYMKVLMEGPEVFRMVAKCHESDMKESLTPLGHKMAWDADTASTRKRLTVAVAGSTCTDHSNIGLGMGLMGPSGIPLAIWVAERFYCEEDCIWHECAPRFPLELVDSERTCIAHKKCKSSTSTFTDLLPGTKKVWLNLYKQSPKVKKMIGKLRQQGRPGHRSTLDMVCNLDQNPLKRPILGAWLPALLKAGTMWLLRAPVSGATTDVDPSERWLLDIEHLHCMGLPQWPIPGSRAPFPIFTYQPAPTVRKRLAGNAMHCSVIGSLHAVVLTGMRVKAKPLAV